MEDEDQKPPEEQTDGVGTEESMEENTKEATEDNTNEATEENTKEATEENTNEATEENAIEATEENAIEATEENTKEATEENTKEATEDNTNEATEENTNEATKENKKEATKENTNETTEEITKEDTEENTKESTEENTKESTEESSKESIEETAKESTEENVDELATEVEEPPPDNEEVTVESEDRPGISASEEQILMEEENQIMDEEERGKNVVEEVVMEDFEPPETKEVIPEEEPLKSKEEADETETAQPMEEFDFEEPPPQEQEFDKVEQAAQDERASEEEIAQQMIERFLGDAIEAVEFVHPLETHGEKEKAGKEKSQNKIQVRVDIQTEIGNSLQMQKPAPKHDYFGIIFSASSKRPPNYYHNYFLPLQKQPTARQHMRILGKVIPKKVVEPFVTVPNQAMPLSTLKIRWRLHRNATVYTSEDLYCYLSRYGPIERVYQLTKNSALVVFSTLETASMVVKMPGIGYPWDPLIADWLEPRMNNRNYYTKYAIIEESPDKTTRDFV